MTATTYHAKVTRTLTVRATDGAEDLEAVHLRAAVREADESGVPDHAAVSFDSEDDGFVQVVTFTWTEYLDETSKED
ncbi:hypothetical protein GCM10027059_48380 [Myceligenerans halotolerans]